ncbi:Integral membrane sensor signal transduction histidine kinase [Acidithiobacillus ferrivorans]|uniref:histidine kinase n=1 Tax=Acidithiobacillus ferrivorans TaxID=160808 RepID=A0A060URE9_9PROT|nr:ATP-binding protein [Acidithiobacillus ferrivorans]CDQ10876.1 Integral membrane sensor signal transduction histidine kinase [Acidithiobacillus ferrivorans]SMH66015.1 Integral membrane sensor signal transduction histidine kinase [Acidithiobacillus ferrivorans]
MKKSRLWPDTLFTRMFLIIAGLLLLSQLAVYWFFNIYQANPQAERLAQNWAQMLTLSETLSPAQRQATASELMHQGLRIVPAGALRGHKPRMPVLTNALQLLHRMGWPQAQLRMDGRRRLLWLQARPEATLALAMPMPHSPGLPLPWFKLAAILLLSWLGAYLAVRQVTRPLTRLMQGVARLRGGDTTADLPEAGPADLRRLAERFNQTLRDLHRLWKEREMVLVGVSHDLRTPLTRMRLSAEFLPAEEAVRGEIIANIQEMDKVIHQFLDYARSGEQEPLVATDLGLWLKMFILRQQAGVVWHPPVADLPKLPIQEVGLARALQNLIDNAQSHGRTPIDVSAEAAAGGVLIRIRDHGPGIAETELETVRAPFAQAGRGGGVGLGLAIVERIVAYHHGRFSLANAPGGGLETRITLPQSR